MKRLLSLAIPAIFVLFAGAKNVVTNVSVENLRMERDGDHICIDMNLVLSELDVESNRSVRLSPWLYKGSDSIPLPTVDIHGRRRYYYNLRNNSSMMVSGKERMVFQAKEAPEKVTYHEFVPFQDWMDGATLRIQRTDNGCCGHVLLNEHGDVGMYQERFFPDLLYIRPSASREKRRTLEGRAYIDFPVDQTIIYPDYRRNSIELAAIRATIDTIRNDADARIDTVWLKGFASPESPYSHNTDLAKGRTEALRHYIQQLYRFDNVAMITDFEPEDWAGLRLAVEGSNLDHRSEILNLIDSDMEPDKKEAQIKRLYPQDYQFMLHTYYPALRHTDYKVSYVIRTYHDPVEILAVMKEHPQNLSLDEFYIAAADMEPGSDEFTEVFETAVRMFPDDAVANLNAANAAMRRGDLAKAARYIDKASDSPEAIYARGALAIRSRDFETARRYLAEAKKAGLAKAAETLEELEKRNTYSYYK